MLLPTHVCVFAIVLFGLLLIFFLSLGEQFSTLFSTHLDVSPRNNYQHPKQPVGEILHRNYID